MGLLDLILSSFLITFTIGLVGYYFFRQWAFNQAKQEASAIIQDAQSEFEMVVLDLKEKTNELEASIFAPFEKDFTRVEERIESFESESEERTKSLEQTKEHLSAQYRKQQSQVDSFDFKVREEKKQIEHLKSEKTKLIENFKKSLQQKLNIDLEQEIQKLAQMEIEDWKERLSKRVTESELNTQNQLEWLAKKMLNRALIRFHRPYSSERGIPHVTIDPDKKGHLDKLLENESQAIKLITEVTGSDILVEEEKGYIAVGGFDPVRREFARRVVERCLREKNELSPNRIHQIADNIKRELFANIKRDGDLLAKELGLQNLHVDIRKMMGSLRYRYSFTQNQYFHCGEVGWLAGLMAYEMDGIDPKKARRAGMLHDLGKAMDHEFDGGHAVVGANFIETKGEAPDVVHAVRAHHYDETPSTPLAYLVIAADAISGSRPGARRSTVESYNQKISDLENIAHSFEGVSDCIILNGGRECRLKVDSQRIDDFKASQIAREVTTRIEEECTYPGQIKVVVVRETIATESKSQRSHHQK
jgi:ribonuclease Y